MAGEQIYFQQPPGKFKGTFNQYDQYKNPITASSLASYSAASPVAAGTFTNTPAPQTGTGAFGLVPGPIGVPQPYNDLSSAFPNLSGTNAAASSALVSRLRGELSPGTRASIEDAAAAYGIDSGSPGSEFSTNRSLRDLGLASENLQQQGLQDYSPLISTISGTQTVKPETQAEIAGTNATNAAAPNPSNTAYYSRWLFQRYQDILNQNKGGNNLGSTIGGLVGAAGGAYFGGPAGASVGYGAGSRIGSAFG